jgi:hypothetical protein
VSRSRKVRRRGALLVTPEISEDASPVVREGLARRRLVATTGQCPCGAKFTAPDDLKPGTVTVVSVEHEAGCPAISPELEQVQK